MRPEQDKTNTRLWDAGGCYDVHTYISAWHAFLVLRSTGRFCMTSRQRGEVGVVFYGSDLGWSIRSVVTVRVVYLFGHALLVRNQCTQCGYRGAIIMMRPGFESIAETPDSPPAPLPSFAKPMSTRLSTSEPTSMRNVSRSIDSKRG